MNLKLRMLPARIRLLWAFLFALPAVVHAQFYWVTNANKTITITGYNCSGGAVVIPGRITGLPVVSIGNAAFANCSVMTNVAIPDSVTSIGASAFYGCGLTSVTIPNTVTNLGIEAFIYNTRLTNVTIPSSVSSIGAGLFYDCVSLTAIPVDPTNPFYTSVNGVLFDAAKTTLIEFPDGAGGSYTIPNGVTKIEDNAFAYCSTLSSVTIPNSVTSIGIGAFNECTGLKDATIPNNVTNIGRRAFYFCQVLTSLVIPKGVTSIPDYTFEQCRSVTNVTIGSGVTSIGYSAFASCVNLQAICFFGNAPIADAEVFWSDSATAYYLPGTTGWGTNYAGLPTALWVLPNPMILDFEPNFGVQGNAFGFTISWATNIPVVVQARTSLSNPVWTALATNSLVSGTNYFSDPNWANYPQRIYRVSAQ